MLAALSNQARRGQHLWHVERCLYGRKWLRLASHMEQLLPHPHHIDAFLWGPCEDSPAKRLPGSCSEFLIGILYERSFLFCDEWPVLRFPSAWEVQHFVSKAAYNRDPIRRCQGRPIILPSCRYHEHPFSNPYLPELKESGPFLI